MATIRIKRGTGTPGFAALSVGEPAVNTNLNTLFIKTASAGNSTDVKLVGAEIEAQTAANGFSAINWGSASDSKLATQNAIETRFMPKAGGTFTGAVSFGQGSTAAGEIRLLEDTDDGSNYTAFKGSARAANITYVMPTTDPTAGQVLSAAAPSSNVSDLSWVDAGAASTVTVTNDDTTTTLYPIFSTATSGSISPKVDSDGIQYNASTDTLTLPGDLAINGGDITTTATTFNIVNSTATTVNAFGDAASITMGSGVSGCSTTIRGGTLAGNTTSQNVFETTATTVNAFGAATTMAIGNTATAAQSVNMFTSSTGASTYNIATGATASATTKTINLGTGAASGSTTNVNIGSSNGGTTNINSKFLNLTSETGTTTLTINRECFPASGSAVAESTRFIIYGGTDDNADDADILSISAGVGGFENTDAYTKMSIGNGLISRYTIAPTSSYFEENEDNYLCQVDFAGGSLSSIATKVVNIGVGHSSGATNVYIGASATASSITLNGSTTITGNLTVNGTTTTMNSSTLTVDDKNIEMGSVIVKSGMQGTVSAVSAIVTFTGGTTTTGLLPGQTLTKTAGTGAFGAGAVISTVDSLTQVTMSVNGQTGGTVTFDSSGATNASANGGGITLKGTTDKTITWDSANSNWTSSEDFNLPTGKVYKINNAQINAGNLAASTSAALGVGTIELGHATDTTLSRTGAGVIAVEGVEVVTISASQTLTNKSLTAPRITTGSHIADANGNELIVFPSAVGSAINEITISNAASGNNPSITASGGGTNISLLLAGKGTGSVSVTTPFLSNCASRSSGSASYFTITGPGDSGITASTESVGVAITPSPRQWATGALTTQREVVFAAPTYAFVGASTITTAVNVDIANPAQGANATITNAYALRAANTNITGTLLVNGTANATFSNTGNVSITPTGGLTINSSVAGSIDNANIGATTPRTGAFTTLTANSTVGLSPANANVTISPTGTGTVSIAPAGVLTLGTAGVTTTVNGNVNAAASNQTVTLSPTGSGTVTIQPAGGLTINPTTAGNINNTNIGASTRGTGAFTTLGANNAVTIQTGTNNQSYTTTGAGTITISSGTAGSMDNMNIGATTAGTGRFSTITATSSITYNTAVIAAAGTTQATATAITTVDVNFVTSGTGGVALPAAVAGRRIVIVNRTSAAINVWPVNGGDDTIDGVGTGATAYVLQAGEYGEFDCSSATAWFSNGTVDGGSY